MQTEEKYLIEVLTSVLAHHAVPDIPTGLDYARFFSLAVNHSVANIVYYGIKDKEDVDKKTLGRFSEYRDKALLKEATQQIETELIFANFESNGIDCIPLKGIVIKKYYPTPDMRLMSDVDILIHSAKREQAELVLKNLGYKFKERIDNQDIYKKNPIMDLEIHYSKKGKFYGGIWERVACKEQKKHIFELSNEDLYLSVIQHMAKHYYDGGIGIRAFLDVYLLNNALADSFDWDYVGDRLSEFGLTEFEYNARQLIKLWFFGKTDDEKINEMSDYIISSNTHGTLENAAITKLATESEKDSDDLKTIKNKYILSYIFPSAKHMKKAFPVIESRNYLLPFFYIYRPFKLLFTKRKRVLGKLQSVMNVDENDIKARKHLIESSKETPADKGNYKSKDYESEKVDNAEQDNEGRKKNIIFIVGSILMTVLFIAVILVISILKTDDVVIEPTNSVTVSEQTTDTESSQAEVSLQIEYGTVRLNEGVYVGPLKNGIPNGKGKLNFYTGESFEGEFVNGVIEGFGILSYTDGNRYEGNWSAGIISGSGLMYYADGTVISGIFKNGIPSGSCECNYSNGDVYIGELVNGIRQGVGRLVFANGDVYDGNYKNGIKSGYGIYTYTVGSQEYVYEGLWENNLQNGVGKLTTPLGEYNGDFVDGLAEGDGIFDYTGGDQYRGSFSKGLRNGYGKYTSSDGAYYDGTWKDGLKSGEGTLRNASGDIITATFVNDIAEGNGKYVYKNGDTATGTFVKGLLNGKATYYRKSDKKTYTVTYSKGKITDYKVT